MYLYNQKVTLLPKVFQAFGLSNSDELDYLSRALGDTTVDVASSNTSSGDNRGSSTSMNSGQQGGSSTSSSGTSNSIGFGLTQAKRALITADELRRLGNDEQILIIENMKPIKCQKYRHFMDERFDGKYGPNPYKE